MDGQPNAGTSRVAIAAPIIPPIGTPTTVIATTTVRMASGVNSNISAVAFGSAPPSPRPVRNRQVASGAGPSAVAASSEDTAISAILASNARRRP